MSHQVPTKFWDRSIENGDFFTNEGRINWGVLEHTVGRISLKHDTFVHAGYDDWAVD